MYFQSHISILIEIDNYFNCVNIEGVTGWNNYEEIRILSITFDNVVAIAITILQYVLSSCKGKWNYNIKHTYSFSFFINSFKGTLCVVFDQINRAIVHLISLNFQRQRIDYIHYYIIQQIVIVTTVYIYLLYLRKAYSTLFSCSYFN